MQFLYTFNEIDPVTLKLEERKLDITQITHINQLDEQERLADGELHTVCTVHMLNGVTIKVADSLDNLTKYLS